MSSTTKHLQQLLAEKQRRNPAKPFQTLEQLLTAPELFGLTTATKCQRSVCRAISGEPMAELADDPDVREIFGCDPRLIPKCKPKEFVFLSGIRIGKSLFAAACCVYWSQTVDVSKLGPGEIPRISIFSYSADLAQVIFDHIVGRMSASPTLSKLFIGEPHKDSCLVRHPSGTPIEIATISNARAGASLVARWSAGAVADEFPRLHGADSAVINWEDARNAVLERILPGAAVLSVGSPWAPSGPAFDMSNEKFGRPTEQLIMSWGQAKLFNPFFWTPEKIEQARKNPDTFITECMGQFASPVESLLTGIELEACTRTAPVYLPYNPRNTYVAAMDPATRSNGWTFVIGTREGKNKKLVVAKEWVGNKMVPLNPREVLTEIAMLCKAYNVRVIDTDRHMFDALQVMAKDLGMLMRQVNLTETQVTKYWLSFKTRMAMGEVELVPDRTLRSDLLALKKKATNRGIKIELPNTGDGRHCDYAPSVILVMSRYLDDTEQDAEPESPETFAAALKERAVKNALEKRQRLSRWAVRG